MAKKSKIDKSVRELMEGIGDLVKRKDGRYKFKSKKKKIIKKVKKTCPHWIFRKGKEVPTVRQDPDHPGMWVCKICGARFPIKPLEQVDDSNPYKDKCDEMLGLVNQIQFWGVKLGGDKEDTKMFIRLRSDLERFPKVAKQILKRVRQRNEFEMNKNKSDLSSQFSAYSSYGYTE